MKQRAYAKINLALNVVGKRADGYHDLEMIMVPINFYDRLSVEIADQDRFDSNERYVNENPDNTILKAINLLKTEFNISDKYAVELVKNIPTQAGLAGGSSDGAAVIRIFDKMYDLHLSYNQKIELAKKIGSDVPFTVFNKPAFVKGTGDKLEFFPFNLDFEIILVKPRAGVSTVKCFENLDYENMVHPDCQLIKQAIINSDYDKFVKLLANSMEDTACKLESSIKEVREKLQSYNFDAVLMSGSGSTVFGITKDLDLVNRALKDFRDQKYFARHVRIIK